MTLAERLMEIATIDNETERAEAAQKFSDDIAEHEEVKTLVACVEQAKFRRSFLSWGRNIFVPDALKDEGFWIVADGSGFLLMFAPKPAN